MQTELQETPYRHEPGQLTEDRLRVLELEQTRLLARHEAMVAQLGSLRNTLRGMERLYELRMQRLEQLGRVQAAERLGPR